MFLCRSLPAGGDGDQATKRFDQLVARGDEQVDAWPVALELPEREAARALALDAHTALAEVIAEEDPGEAARLLLAAVEVDPMAEAVYRQAMRACHRIGDAQTTRNLLRQLASQLEAVGGEPADETVELAEKLRAELNQPPGPARNA